MTVLGTQYVTLIIFRYKTIGNYLGMYLLSNIIIYFVGIRYYYFCYFKLSVLYFSEKKMNKSKSNKICCVVGCSNTYKNTDQIQFYNFPN